MQSLQQTISSLTTKSFSSYAKDAFQVIGGSLFLAFASQIAIPFMPVPLTMQTFAVMLLAATFGKVKGTLSVIAYIVESMIGLPVTSQMAIAPLAIVGVRGGYIFGFIVQAYLTGVLFEKYSKASYKVLLSSLLLISTVQLSMGTLWLGSFIGWNQALMVGFYPFILGEVIKCASIVKLFRKA